MRHGGTRSDTKPDDVVPPAVLAAIAEDPRLTRFARQQLLDLVEADWGSMIAVSKEFQRRLRAESHDD